LNAFIEQVRRRVLGGEPFSFARPGVRFLLKDENRYRALCRFGLEDNLINCLIARYLRDFLDRIFDSASYAFRSPNAQGVMPTHHGAFETLFQLKYAAPRQDFYVAECDIQGFYDTVHHGISLGGLERLIRELTDRSPGCEFHPRAREVFRAYLDCFSFPRNVIMDSQERFKRDHPKAIVPWPEGELRRYYVDPQREPIGVPQGGALSCIIANIVLDHADKRVRRAIDRLGTEIHYFRYCDDMILLASNETHCRLVFEEYLRALEELRLPYHIPQRVDSYSKQFWKIKSKNAYRWTGSKGPGCVPWIQFVGYQIRYDGLVRIKKKSIEKHLRKIRNATDHLKCGLLGKRRDGTLGRPVTGTKRQVMLSLLWKLTSMGVGRVNLKDSSSTRPGMCWAAGFKGLHGKPLVPGFLKRLDREREKQLLRMDQARIPYGEGVSTRHSGRGMRPLPGGLPFSYLGQFQDYEGRRLINNPYRPWFRRFISHPLFLAAHYHQRLFRIARKWLRSMGALLLHFSKNRLCK